MNIYLDTIGCKLNLAELESMALGFRSMGHKIVTNPAEAELVVINTCTVTGQAAADSRAAIRRVFRRGGGRIVVTGCWATIEPEAASRLDGVWKVIPNEKKDNLITELFGSPEDFYPQTLLKREPLPGIHGRTRAFIKVQDGCDNTCAYCITTIARGKSRSRPVDRVTKDVNAALEGGSKEIILSGVHLGAWGRDLVPKMCLEDLISTLLSHYTIPRLRLSSLEPWDLGADFFSLWRDPCLCRHLHLPLQSGSSGVLKRMKRLTTPGAYAALIETARAIIPEVAITTDIMVGFPGETETEFDETLEFVRSIGFAGGHIFSYSARPGTLASSMTGQVNANVRKMRSAQLRALINESAIAYRKKFLGRTVPVLWEASKQPGLSGWRLQGLTDNNLRVQAIAEKRLWNQISDVQIIGVSENGLEGIICSGKL